MVVVFDRPVVDAEAKRQRLEALVESFSGASNAAGPTPAPGGSARAELNEALARLAARADAAQAIVIDVTSPVLWGTSHDRPAIAADALTVQRRADLIDRAAAVGLDVADWLTERAAGARDSESDRGPASVARALNEEFSASLRASPNAGRAHWRRLALVTKAICGCRQRVGAADAAGTTLRGGVADEPVAWLGRAFARIYVLLLVFDGPVSQLHAEGAMIQSLATIERLVLSLPPVDPPRRGARVIRLKR